MRKCPINRRRARGVLAQESGVRLKISGTSKKGNFRAPCIGVSTEERLDKIEHDVEVLQKQMTDLLERFLKYVQDVDEDPVKD